MNADILAAFLNWLWQGTMVTALVAVVLRVWPRLSAATRERLWCLTLATVIGAPLFAYFGWRSTDGITTMASPHLPVATLPAIEPVWLRAAGGIWLLWILGQSVALAMAAVQAFRVRQAATPLPPEREARLTQWQRLRDTTSARLLTSPRVRHAAVVGVLRPSIVLSPGLLIRLTDAEIDQVVLHEYAHIHRRDAIALLLQRAVHVVMGFHPGVWWLNRQIALDREMACDDWVIAQVGAPKAYCRCLLKLAASPSPVSAALLPHATAGASQVARRIAYALDSTRQRALAPSRAVVAAVPVLIALAVVCSALDLVSPARMVAAMLDVALPPTMRARVDEIRLKPDPALDETEEIRLKPDPTFVVTDAIRLKPDPTSEEMPRVGSGFSRIESADVIADAAALDTLPLQRVSLGALPLPAPRDVLAQHPTPVWETVADAGETVGRELSQAGQATGRAFKSAGQSIGRIF